MLEPSIFKRIDLSSARTVLDLGCGVGAQSRHLLKKWPQLTVTGADASADQLAAAERLLRVETRTKRFVPVAAKASALPFKDGSFDAVFICFVLEHLEDPAAALGEARRVVKKGGSVYCTEVFNSGVYMYPHHAAVERYWAAFNEYQRQLGGDPDIGIKLPALLAAAGFSKIDYFESAGPLMDRRMKSPAKRRRFMHIWRDLFCGPGEALCRAGRTDADQMDAVRRHLMHLAKNPEGIFFYAAFQARAVKG